ncbi:MAG TPA: S8 family peptidase, partial [Candidatus Polarisedimenticolaceae bacterium]|nr:S8 family peptidase [Candidatus Polarisedimenticolaceae bacterium]
MSTLTPLRRAAHLSILLAFALITREARGQQCGGTEPEIVPGGKAVAGRVLVKFKPHLSDAAIAALNASLGSRISGSFRHAPDLKLVSLPRGMSVTEGVRWFAHRPEVVRAEPDAIFEIDVVPIDARFGDQWGLHNVGQDNGLADFDVDAPEAWDLISASPTVVIGSIDTGVQLNHMDLSSVWTNPGEQPGNGIDDDGNGYVDDLNGYDFFNHDGGPWDDNAHGTHVMGIAAASGNNGIGVAGVTWNAKVMALKVCNACGQCPCSAIVPAVDYATDMGARVTNNSYGGTFQCAGLDEAIGRAEAAGVLFVAAAGNSSSDNDQTHVFPAGFDHDNIIAVAATARDGTLAAFSNYGATTVDLGAPGQAIWSTIPDKTFGIMSGTSMAAPFVTGAIALLMAYNPHLS